MEETLCFILMKSAQIWKADKDQAFYLILCFIFDRGLSVAGTGHLSNIYAERALIWFDVIHGVKWGAGHLSDFCLWKKK